MAKRGKDGPTVQSNDDIPTAIIPMSLEQVRRWYAEEVRFVSGIESGAIVDAFAVVPRERFLGKPPWLYMSAHRPDYWTDGNADVRNLYHDVLVAIDESQRINNGGPSWHAALMGKVNPKRGERVVHIGCGAGYYSAIFAEIVGLEGRVLAIEVNEPVAKRAQANLKPWKNVETLWEDGANYDFGLADVIYVNAGVDRIPRAWVERLAHGGRLILPLTLFEQEGGRMLLVVKRPTEYEASLVQPVHIYPCVGMRSDESTAKLREALTSTKWKFDGVLRLEEHKADSRCWLHHEDCCLSFRESKS